MNSRILQKSAAIGLLALSLSLPARGADNCIEWMETYAGYEEAVYEAIRDEPENLLKELRRYTKAVERGDSEQAKIIETKVRKGLTGLIAIDPHPDMNLFHADLIECYRCGVGMIDIAEEGDEVGRHEAELRTWQSFRILFATLRELLTSHDCDEAEIEAIDQRYLPQIDAQIEVLKHKAGR